MRVTIIGAGYVGLTTGACLADLGNHVVCLDRDEARVALLRDGRVPIFEPGLQELIAANADAGRLSFTTDAAAAIARAEVIFIAVGTPAGEDGSADVGHVVDAARCIGRHLDGFTVVVDKSTVPVGTAERVATVLAEEIALRGDPQAEFSVVSNPEFLKEGAALADFMRPDRIVLGVADDAAGQRALALMRQLYAPFNRNRERTCVMDVRSAEFTKYAANAMLATRISFINELANLADKLGVDIEMVRQAIGADPRIGHSFLYAGTGYGGSCFPKDLQALIHSAHEHDQSLRVLEAVEAVNQDQKHVLERKVFDEFGVNLDGRHFAVWGLAFKPNTDDMREAPSRPLICTLLRAGATVAAHDPVAGEQALQALRGDLADQPELLGRLSLAERPMEALEGADALVIVTEWKAYRSPDLAAIKASLRRPLVIDGRNLYEPAAMRRAGLHYKAIGRAAP